MIAPIHHFGAVCAALLLGMASAIAADKPAPEDSVGDAWQKAVKAGDLDAVMKLYADDAIGWFPDEAAHVGAAAIRASYKDMFDGNTVEAAALTNRHHVSDAKHRSNWGNFSITLRQKADGKTVTLSGRYTDVQELRGGHWVYVVDHASLEPPPAPK